MLIKKETPHTQSKRRRKKERDIGNPNFRSLANRASCTSYPFSQLPSSQSFSGLLNHNTKLHNIALVQSTRSPVSPDTESHFDTFGHGSSSAPHTYPSDLVAPHSFHRSALSCGYIRLAIFVSDLFQITPTRYPHGLRSRGIDSPQRRRSSRWWR